MSNVTSLSVNGVARPCDADAARSLLSVLRDDLALTGTKYGCGEGQCGACTVLVDGVPVRSCLTPVGTVGPQKITTVEGLAQDGKLHALQQAFLDLGALQCGYCTSGMLMSGVALLAKNPHPTDDEIVRFMDGNLCRCGTYPRIVAAIQQAARRTALPSAQPSKPGDTP
ncbi:MAG: (2Fe-2S)-binding protein [Verrucomicrobia bacterium]|nr:(2Fe-2S)-binding protein [Verrucomicrobiota bacterium]